MGPSTKLFYKGRFGGTFSGETKTAGGLAQSLSTNVVFGERFGVKKAAGGQRGAWHNAWS